MAPSASDIPSKYDVLINGQGYLTVLDDQSGLYYRPRRAAYGRTPTFLERTNVSGDYGDDQQQFWLTFTQRDWSLGEQQRFFKSSDPDKARRYWGGSFVDVAHTPGQVAMGPGTDTPAPAAVLTSSCPYGGGSNVIAAADATNLYSIASTLITSLGAHSSAAAPITMCADQTDQSRVFMSDGANIRLYNGSVFSTFSANGAKHIEYLNNTLYGFMNASKLSFFRYDTAGTQTTLFEWKNASGGSITPDTNTYGGRYLARYGGKLMILMAGQIYTGIDSLWLFNGTAPALVAEFPPGFIAQDMTVVNGIVYVSGLLSYGVGRKYLSSVYYYTNGTLGLLWQQSPSVGLQSQPHAGPRLGSYSQGLVFTDPATSSLYSYNPSTGGVSCVDSTGFAGLSTGANRLTSSFDRIYHHSLAITSVTKAWPSSTTATTASIRTSLFDGESSLTKIFRAIKVDYDSATDGDGGSVDIAYQLNSVDSSYTTLQTGATAGTEYLMTNITGRSISVKVTLNKGTSTSGPILKRIYVRAIPQLQQFRRCEYILDLSGEKGKDMLQLRDNTNHVKDGATMAADLNTAITSTAPISITDRFGTYTGIIEPDQTSIIEVKPGVFVAHVVAREI